MGRAVNGVTCRARFLSIGDFASSLRVCLIDQLLAGLEEVAITDPEFLQQPVQCVVVMFKTSIFEDVRGAESTGDKMSNHENRAMAGEWIFFRAKERDPVAGGAIDQSGEAALEQLGLGESVVLNLSIDVAAPILRAGS